MKLIRFSPSDNETPRPGLWVNDTIHDLSGWFASAADFLAEHPEGWLPEDVEVDGLPTFSRSSVHLLAPIDDGARVFAVAINYKKHAEESDLEVPSQPIIFDKPTTSLVGPGEPIVIPAVTRELDYEGELGVVIGREARQVAKADVPHYVAGLTIVNDTTARDLQWVDLGKHHIVDWLSSKCLDRTSPLGPAITSAKVAGDPHQLKLTTHLNETIMQDSNTSRMVFSVWDLIEFLSARGTLLPGDVLATGTPFGVGSTQKVFLKPGDTVRVEVENVGVLENQVEAG